MPKICYVSKNFAATSLKYIALANQICEDYEQQGFVLTLRQLYYQFVSRDVIPNSERSYKNLGSLINDARLAGLIDWFHLEDRTRNVRENPHWADPSEIITSCAKQFRHDKWSTQTYRPEVWIEKDALVGVISGVCRELDIPYFSCRGYTSASEMWAGAMRLKTHAKAGQVPIVFHLGDHDPSGLDMTRDITDRLSLFSGGAVELKRLALNMDQIRAFNPPPNPAKTTDARFLTYQEEYGDESWELDAMEPAALVQLISVAVSEILDEDTWAEAVIAEDAAKEDLKLAADNWEDMIETAKGNY